MDFMKDVVSISITNVTGNTNMSDLNTILILAKHDVFTAVERFRLYTDAADAKADGFADDSYVYKALQVAFSQEIRPRRVVVSYGLDTAALVADYITVFESMLMIKQGWLWLVSDLDVAADQLKLAQAVEATEKFYAASTTSVDAFNGAIQTDLGSLLKAQNLAKSFAWFDDVKGTEIAILARCSGAVAGTIQFVLKSLRNVALSTRIVNPTQINTLISKGYTFVAEGNNEIYSYGAGKLANGEWIDIGLGITWIKTRIRERVFNLLTSEDKLPMDNDGASSIEGTVRSVLIEARDLKILAADTPIVVTTPDVTTLAKAVRAGRILPDVRFSARLRGAIIGTTIRGEVFE